MSLVKTAFFCLISVCLLSICYAQKVVRIDFHSGSQGNYDYYIRDCINKTKGYSAYVNYHGRSDDMPYDFLLTYEDLDSILVLRAFDKQGTKIKDVRQQLTDYKIQSTYHAVARFTRKGVRVDDAIRITPKAMRNIEVEVKKIDSAEYIINARANAAHTARDMEVAFLEYAHRLSSSYKTYYEIEDYHYQVEVSGETKHRVGQQILGIVVGTQEHRRYNGRMMEEPPQMFNWYKELNKEILWDPVESDSTFQEASYLFIIRDSGSYGSDKAFSVLVDGAYKCKIANRRYIQFAIEEGIHKVVVQSGGKSVKKNAQHAMIKSVPGRNNYVSVLLENDLSLKVQPRPMREFDAKKMMRPLTEDLCEN